MLRVSHSLSSLTSSQQSMSIRTGMERLREMRRQHNGGETSRPFGKPGGSAENDPAVSADQEPVEQPCGTTTGAPSQLLAADRGNRNSHPKPWSARPWDLREMVCQPKRSDAGTSEPQVQTFLLSASAKPLTKLLEVGLKKKKKSRLTEGRRRPCVTSVCSQWTHGPPTADLLSLAQGDSARLAPGLVTRIEGSWGQELRDALKTNTEQNTAAKTLFRRAVPLPTRAGAGELEVARFAVDHHAVTKTPGGRGTFALWARFPGLLHLPLTP